jgi:hypothetical protein
MPTSRSITTTARSSASVGFCRIYGRIFENRLDSRVEAVLNADSFVAIGDTLVLAKFFDDTTVE